MATSSNLFISVSPVVQKLILTSGVKLAAQASTESIASQLCAAAERLYLNRDYVSLSQVADVLSSLPNSEAQAASLLYRAVIERSNGREETAARLLEGILSTKAAPRFHARAIQALGVGHRYAGDMREAARLYNQAIERSTGPHLDLLTLVNGVLARSEIASTEGDHERAVADLRAVRPAVELLAQVHPVYAPLFANDIAYELLQTGRIEEARRFAAFACASPVASRFPVWAETAREIEEQAASIAAYKSILRVVVRPARSRGLRRSSRTLFLIPKLALKASRRRLQPRIAIFTRELPRSRPTLEQVSLKIRIRAPSF